MLFPVSVLAVALAAADSPAAPTPTAVPAASSPDAAQVPTSSSGAPPVSTPTGTTPLPGQEAATPAAALTEALATYATQVHRALAAARIPGSLAKRPGLVQPAVATVELRIGEGGALRALAFGPSNLPRGARELAPGLVLASEPLPPPDPALLARSRDVGCVARLALVQDRKRIRADAAVACLGSDGTVGAPAGDLSALGDAPDAAAALLSGWAADGAGDAAAASAQYGRAVSLAPDWDLASRALGLALVKQKRVAAAIPYLRTYVAARAGAADAYAFGREIERFEREQAARAAEFTRLRPRLGKEELILGVRKGYPLLEPCLAKARQKGLLAVGTDTIFVTFRINKDGSVGTSQLDGPTKLLMSEAAECLERNVLAWRFPPYSEGSEVTAKRLPIKVRGASPEPEPSATGGTAVVAAAPEPVEEPTFASCERPADDVTAYVTARSRRIAACLEAEYRRNPNGWPDSLPISFVVDAQGPVRNVSLNHRYFRDGPAATCVSQALAGTLGPVGGADCPAELPVDLRPFATRH